MHVTSRFYSFLTRKIQFPTQSEQEIRELIKRRTFWFGMQSPVEIAHPYDCQYVNQPREKMIELAQQLATQNLIYLDGDRARAGEALHKEAPAMRATMQKGVDAGIAATKVTA